MPCSAGKGRESSCPCQIKRCRILQIDRCATPVRLGQESSTDLNSQQCLGQRKETMPYYYIYGIITIAKAGWVHQVGSVWAEPSYSPKSCGNLTLSAEHLDKVSVLGSLAGSLLEDDLYTASFIWFTPKPAPKFFGICGKHVSGLGNQK